MTESLRPETPSACAPGLSAVGRPGGGEGSEAEAVGSLLLPRLVASCCVPSRGGGVAGPPAFPFPLPPAFPHAGSCAFLAHGCVWAPICQAVTTSKKTLFLLDGFQDVMQTCLNYAAAVSALRSASDFVLIRAGEGKTEAETQSAGTPSSILSRRCPPSGLPGHSGRRTVLGHTHHTLTPPLADARGEMVTKTISSCFKVLCWAVVKATLGCRLDVATLGDLCFEFTPFPQGPKLPEPWAVRATSQSWGPLLEYAEGTLSRGCREGKAMIFCLERDQTELGSVSSDVNLSCLVPGRLNINKEQGAVLRPCALHRCSRRQLRPEPRPGSHRADAVLAPRWPTAVFPFPRLLARTPLCLFLFFFLTETSIPPLTVHFGNC